MDEQLKLANTQIDYSISTDSTRSSPVVWIKELRVVRDLDGQPESLIRKLEFKLGMNIVWAKPVNAQQQSKLFDFGLAGHAAGKSTMCRFIRFALGEASFGDDTLRREIRESFPKAWVVAKVFIDDMPWVVCRPLHVGARGFVVRTDDIEDLFAEDCQHEGLDVYFDALNSAAVAKVTIKSLPTSRSKLKWEHLLPWITRDQDCHFDNLIQWRDKSSDSQSQPLEKSDRHHLLRAILRLVSDEEHKERVANQKRLAKARKLTNELPILQSQSNKDRDRLENVFKKQLPEFDDGLFKTAVGNEIDAYAVEQRKKISSIEFPAGVGSLAELEAAVDDAVQQHALKSAELTNAKLHHEKQVTQLAGLKGDLTQQQRDQLVDELGPSHRSHCSIPAAEASAGGCPLYEARSLKFGDSVASEALDSYVPIYESRVANAFATVDRLTEDLKPITAHRDSLKAALKNVREEHQSRVGAFAKIDALVLRLKTLAEDAETSWKDANKNESEIDGLEIKIRRSRTKQEKIRADAITNLDRFSKLFDYFISALLGTEVSGEVILAGRDLELKVLYRGDRRSSAIKVVKNLAFDLAALTSSIEGRGDHPRFLIHDGPREADMSPDLYRKLFLLVEMIQYECSEDNPPAFQYIITTTEPPPAKMQKSPWIVKPIFDASDPEKRFLGVDL